MAIERFEDVVAWQVSRRFANEMHLLLRDCRDWSFKDQVQRACLSIMNNIAEGFDRKGDKEFVRYLSMAKGSCAEARSMIYLALDYGYVVPEKAAELHDVAVRINRILAGFIRALRERPNI